MIQALDIFSSNLVFVTKPVRLLPFYSCFTLRNRATFRKRKLHSAQFQSPVIVKLVDHAERSIQTKGAAYDDGSIDFPHVQTLSNISKEELSGKVIMVRFDSVILLQGGKENESPPSTAFLTIKYLYQMGAKIILVGSWSDIINYPSTESVADFLSMVLGINVVHVKLTPGYTCSHVEDRKNCDILLLENLFHFKGEVSNCPKFAKDLTSGVDIIVNDAFSQIHKVLSSTVGVASFCYACIAGFYFEEELYKMKEIVQRSERPYTAIIGGSNLAEKATALQVLLSICDGLFFAGSMAFQIMHALGVSVPLKLVDLGSVKQAKSIMELAKSKGIPIVLPKDVWCIKDHTPEKIEIFCVDSIPEGWQPIDIGPASVQEMSNLLSNCKRITWLGPLKFSTSRHETFGTLKLTEGLGPLSQSSCNITFVGKTEFHDELFQKSRSSSNIDFIRNAVVVWEVLKGGKLPGLNALDRAYPSNVDWSVIYADPTRPLIVDIGSGNGLFLFGMARSSKHENFLGLEMNAKLVNRCLDNVHQLGVQNVHFIATNATSTFRSIVSSYPGELVLVSIQCPNPDFNKPEHRWRMLQRSLVEAIADMLVAGGKVFLQSDIKAVSLRMIREFMEYSKGMLLVLECPEDQTLVEGGWLKANPFGVPSDWEQHVLDRGDPMYRRLLSKVEGDAHV